MNDMTKPIIQTTLVTSHTMRLRSRSRTMDPNLKEAANLPNVRPVLGDVSNKRNSKVNSQNLLGAKEIITHKCSKPNLHAKSVIISDAVNEENLSSGKNSNQEKLTEKRPVETLSSMEGRKKRRTVSHPNAESNEKTSSSSYKESQSSYCDENSIEERQETPKSYLAFPMDYCMHQTKFAKDFYDDIYENSLTSLDKESEDDVLMAAEYVTDLYQHLYHRESTCRPVTYMCQQRDINARMRAILIDWLVDVHHKFRLEHETLHLCVNIIDRYCGIVPVLRCNLQLVGVTALLIASKYEEVYPPEVNDCVFVTDKAYKRQRIIDMERDMLSKLRFKIGVPTGYPFLLRFLNITKASCLAKHAANYYMERTLQEHDLLNYRASLIAAAAVALALSNPDIRHEEQKLGIENAVEVNIKILTEYTGFRLEELIECASRVGTKVGEVTRSSSRRLESVRRKYSGRKYQFVSTLKLPCASYIPMNDLDKGSRE